jgi:hypothetical protein
VARSTDAGLLWKRASDIGGQPAAFDSAGNELYVALHDGMIKRSTDAAKTWTIRAAP